MFNRGSGCLHLDINKTAIVQVSKNEFDFIERGTGLNNTINIVLNGSAGSVLLVSGRGLIYLEKNKVIKRKLSKDLKKLKNIQ